MGTEGYQTLGSEHTMQYTDDAPENCTLETYINVIEQCHPKGYYFLYKPQYQMHSDSSYI